MMANSLMRDDPFVDIARFDPFRSVDDLLSDFSLLPGRRAFGMAPRMRIDVNEDAQNYLVKADIPGVSKDDIKVAIEGSQVSVTAEVKEEEDASGAGCLCRERRYGQQHRSFTLPQEVDDTKAEAKYENGVLQLVLPKKSGTGRKQLTIQ